MLEAIFIVIIVLSGEDTFGFVPKIFAVRVLFVFGIPAIPFIFWEYQIRQFRKENGLPIYKNIEEDLIQMEIDQQVAREQKAYKKVTESTDKNDINYWYDLFQKGAITKDEYEAKKRELL